MSGGSREDEYAYEVDRIANEIVKHYKSGRMSDEEYYRIARHVIITSEAERERSLRDYARRRAKLEIESKRNRR